VAKQIPHGNGEVIMVVDDERTLVELAEETLARVSVGAYHAELAKTGVSPTGNLARLFVSLKQTKGWNNLVKLIYNTTASLNGFDQYGHYGRTLVSLANCTEYTTNPEGLSGCDSNFHGGNAFSSASSDPATLLRFYERSLEEETGGTSASLEEANGPTAGLGQAKSAEGAEPPTGPNSASEATEPLLNYLLGK